MKMCEYCIQEMKSRGEKIHIGDRCECEKVMFCEWCDEEDEELFEVEFSKRRINHDR